MNRMFFCAIAVCSIARPCVAGDSPNIVLIISDDQAWTDYSFMGHKVIQTPHLDRLAKRSATFPRGYVPTALCRPSLMTLATGLYTHQHKTSGNDPSHALASPKTQAQKYKQLQGELIAHIDQHPTVAKLLGAKGYLSHQSGKWWEGDFKRGGFTHGMSRGFPQRGGRHGDDGLTIGRKGMKPVFDFIDESVAAEKPFFVWYAPFLPHTPHTPPKRLLDKYKDKVDSLFVAKYYAMCEWFDETVGQLVEKIDESGQADNTLIVYICDNGWIQSQAKRGYAPRSKQTANEGGTRQPTMFCWPGVIKPGDRGKQLCSSVDLVPTMLSAGGVDVPKGLPGFDLMPILKSGEPTPRKEVFGEGFAHDIRELEKPEASLLYRWVVEDKWKLLLTYDGEVGRYKTSHPRTEKRPQLFNLVTDPGEQKNVASENAAVVARLAKKIDGWWPVKERSAQKTWTVAP